MIWMGAVKKARLEGSSRVRRGIGADTDNLFQVRLLTELHGSGTERAYELVLFRVR